MTTPAFEHPRDISASTGPARTVRTVLFLAVLPVAAWQLYLTHRNLRLLASPGDEQAPALNEDATGNTGNVNSDVNTLLATRKFRRNNFTFSTFQVAGVDLAAYGLDGAAAAAAAAGGKATQTPFELFDDFDLSRRLVGNETWVDLVRHRRDAEGLGLPFYVDKIARRRWLPTRGIQTPRTLGLRYASELTGSGEVRDEERAIRGMLPVGEDYVAKPTHLSCSGGVWLTKRVNGTNSTLVGHGKKPMQALDDFSERRIARSLAEDLHRVMEICGRTVKESWALQNVRPGVMVEERFASWEEGQDDRGGMEFKVFTIWGRAWLAVWRPGVDGVRALFRRDGTNLHYERAKNDPLPDWIDWQRIVNVAEELGAHKDMFRTDIFVGVPAGSPALREGATREERLAAVRYVVSETEIHPTPLRGTEEIFDEAGRLWLAGYAIGNYKVVPDSEVPPEFVKTGQLSMLYGKTK